MLVLCAALLVVVLDVRGVGLLMGVELSVPIAPVVSAATELGLMLISAGETVLRLCPPLIITQEQIQFALHVIEQAIQHAEDKAAAAATAAGAAR